MTLSPSVTATERAKTAAFVRVSSSASDKTMILPLCRITATVSAETIPTALALCRTTATAWLVAAAISLLVTLSSDKLSDWEKLIGCNVVFPLPA